MQDTNRQMEVPAVVNGRTIGTATFTVTAIETPGGVTATVNFGEKLIGQLGFASGTGFENVMATIRNLLTPLPSLRHS